MEIFQKHCNRSEQILLLLLMAFAVLPSNPVSDQRSSKADAEEKSPQKMSSTENPKKSNKNNKRKNPPHSCFHHIKLNFNFSMILGPKRIS